MRLKIEQHKKAITKPVSLYPEQVKFANSRSLGLGMSMSRYVQKLIDEDRTKDLIGKILRREAKEASR